MEKAFNEEWVIGKVHPFRDRVFEDKYLFVFRENRFFKAIKPRECVKNGVIIAGDEINAMVELFDMIEPAMIVVRGDFEMICMYVLHSTKKHHAELCQNHDNGEEFFVAKCIM